MAEVKRLLKLFVLQVLGEAVLLAMFWTWLGIGDAKTWQLILSALLGLLIAAGFAWLQTYTFAAASSPAWKATLRSTVGHAPRFLLIIAGFGIACWLLAQLPVANAAQAISSYLTLHLRVPVRPAKTLANFQAVIAIIQWVILPIVLLPVASEIARGIRPLGPSLQPRVWAGFGIGMVCGVYVPWKLVHWPVQAQTPALDLFLFLSRFVIAYLLCCAAIVVVAAVTAGGIPVATQPTTVERP